MMPDDRSVNGKTDVASWFPSTAAGSASPGQLSPAHKVFNNMLQDPTLFAAFSTVCSTFGFATSSTGTQTLEQQASLLSAKSQVYRQLRRRLSSPDPPSDILLMTIIILLGLELVDGGADIQAPNASWEAHMGGIDQILAFRKRNGLPPLKGHVKDRLSVYADFFKHIRAGREARRDRPASAIDWPSGFRCFRYKGIPFYSIIDSLQSIKSECRKYEKLQERFPTHLLASTRTIILSACSLIVNISRKPTPPSLEIFLLGLTMYAQYFESTLVAESIMPPDGSPSISSDPPPLAPVIDPLFSVRCTIFACHPHLTALVPFTSEFCSVLLWAGCILQATLSPRHPGAQLGKRLMRICATPEKGTLTELISLCEERFWWDDGLTGKFIVARVMAQTS